MWEMYAQISSSFIPSIPLACCPNLNRILIKSNEGYSAVMRTTDSAQQTTTTSHTSALYSHIVILADNRHCQIIRMEELKL